MSEYFCCQHHFIVVDPIDSFLSVCVCVCLFSLLSLPRSLDEEATRQKNLGKWRVWMGGWEEEDDDSKEEPVDGEGGGSGDNDHRKWVNAYG